MDTALLLGDEDVRGDDTNIPLMQNRTWWRLTHVTAFALGGGTFVAGTALLNLPASPPLATATAVLYTVGSLGFLLVDLLEFATFTSWPLRGNIALAATGSALYVVGSLGFLPTVAAATPAVGIWGFIAGSAVIAVSEAWKLLRLATPGSHPGAWPTLSTALSSADTRSAVGVEAGAFIGAWGFLAGTVLDDTALGGASYAVVLALWMLGSAGFTAGALCLAHRHFVLRLS